MKKSFEFKGVQDVQKPVAGLWAADSQTVMSQLKAWFDDYNSYHPHSALGYLPPQMFREKRTVN